ncbi:MAG: drug resistance transporter, EmrB/QacA subfamily [Conexibacter sp.]|nr:drug resistance transporter, EmrB/QacA subfamily [Conexibacter sp.]
MTATPAANTGRSRETRKGNPWLTLVAVALGVMMVGLDGTVVGVANPTIARDLGASLAGLQWVTNGYLLALAVTLILGGKLGDRFGRKRIFIIGIVGFALTSLGCALSSSIGMLVGFRVLQGLAGAMLMPNTLALLRATFPAERLNQAVGIWGGASALAVASGPIIGGLLVENVSWQSIFLLNLPLGAIAALFTFAYVRESRDEEHVDGFDAPGIVLLTGGLFLVIWALIKAQDHGWGSAYVLGFGAAGLLTLAAFVVRERATRAPLLPLDLFRSRSLSAGTVLVVAGFFALFGVLFFVGLYLQNVHGYTPVQTGVRLLPLTATFVVSAPLGGSLTARFGARVPLCGGMLMFSGAFYGLTHLEAHSSYSAQWPYFLVIGLALGLVIVASTEAIVGSAPVERGGIAGGLQSTANQLGGVLGTAVLGSIIVSSVAGSLPGKLRDAGVPPEVSAQVLAHKELVGQGIAPVSAQMPADLRTQVTEASFSSFMGGLHTAMWVGVFVTLVGAALALLVRRGAHEGSGTAHVGI